MAKCASCVIQDFHFKNSSSKSIVYLCIFWKLCALDTLKLLSLSLSYYIHYSIFLITAAIEVFFLCSDIEYVRLMDN